MATERPTIPDNVILRVLAGSRSFGLATEASDRDIRGVFLAPPREFFSLDGPRKHVDLPESEEFYWELQRFCALALKANPNLLECLHTQEILHITPLGQELLDLKEAFLSKRVYQTYLGYAQAQFRRIKNQVDSGRRVKWKHAMHLCRLLISGRDLLASGVLRINVHEHRDRLLAIKNGLLPWAEIEEWKTQLEAAMEAAYQVSHLPDAPDVERVNVLLVRARLEGIQG